MNTPKHLVPLSIIGAVSLVAIIGALDMSAPRASVATVSSASPSPAGPPMAPVSLPWASRPPADPPAAALPPTPSPSPPQSRELPARIEPCTAALASGAIRTQAPERWDDIQDGTSEAPSRDEMLLGFTGMHADGTPGPNPAIVQVDLRNGSTRRLATFAKEARPFEVSVSPTGRQIAFSVAAGSGMGTCSALYVIVDDRLVHVTTVRGGIGFSWAPDGASIAVDSTIFHADGTSMSLAASIDSTIRRRAGPTTTQVSACDGCTFAFPSLGFEPSPWSPDGQRIAATRDGSPSIWEMEIATGVVTEVPGSVGDFSGWRDPHTLLLIKGPAAGPWHWAAVDLNGSESRAHVGVTVATASRLGVAPNLSAAAGSACLKCPFVVAGSACIGCPFVDVDGGRARTIWHGRQPVSMTWSPDSRTIAFAVRGGGATGGTWIVGANGKGLRRVSTKVLAGLAWAPAPH